MKLADLTVNMAVQVHAFGRWYPGHVVSVGITRVKVTFATGGGVRTRHVSPTELAPAGTFTGYKRGQPYPGSDVALAAIAERRAGR